MGIVLPWILSAQPGVVAVALDGQRQVGGEGIVDRLAVVERFERGELVLVLLDGVGELDAAAGRVRMAFICDHGPDSNALRAALTARSMSALSPSATWQMTSPVAGLRVANVLPDCAIRPTCRR